MNFDERGLDLRSWVMRMSSLCAEFERRFEARFGYPPGENQVRLAGDDRDDLRLLAELGCATELLDFYAVVKEVSLPDLGVGTFVHSARHVLTGLRGTMPTLLGGATEDSIVVFGSDGGGALFALSASGRGVYRLRGGAFVADTYDADQTGVTTVAPDLHRFLGAVLAELEGQVIE
ncbi:hypothetical protein [Amycolatopsis orientalis]|uniref:hypothetical protein n=1 Tax=Amycolatopsis orientalis TaxID=31958 RepID=UPI0011AB802B|nr:hypothetical protein [Amycolatopsis orientalis]